MLTLIASVRMSSLWVLPLALSVVFLAGIHFEVEAKPLLVVGRVVTNEGAGLEGAKVTVEFTEGSSSSKIEATSRVEGFFVVTFEVGDVNLLTICQAERSCTITANVLGTQDEDGRFWAGSGETNIIQLNISVEGLLGQAFPTDLLSSTQTILQTILEAMNDVVGSVLGKILAFGTTLSTDLVEGVSALKVEVAPLDQTVGDLRTKTTPVEQLRDQVKLKLTVLDCSSTPEGKRFLNELEQANQLIEESNELIRRLAQRDTDLGGEQTVERLKRKVETNLNQAKSLLGNILQQLKPSISSFSLFSLANVAISLEPGEATRFKVVASHVCGSKAIASVEIVDVVKNENVGIFAPSSIDGPTLEGTVTVSVPKLDKRYEVYAIVTDKCGEKFKETGAIRVKSVDPKLEFKDVAGDPGEEVELKLIVVHKNADDTPKGRQKIRDEVRISSPTGLNTTPSLQEAKWSKTHEAKTGTFTFTTKVKIAKIHNDQAFTINRIGVKEGTQDRETTGTFTVNDVVPEITALKAYPEAIRPITTGTDTTGTETVARVEITVNFTDINGFEDATEIELMLNNDKTRAVFAAVSITPPIIFTESLVGSREKGMATFVVTITKPESGTLVFLAHVRDTNSCPNERCVDSAEFAIPIENKPPDFRGRGSTRLPPEDADEFEQPPSVTCPGDLIRVVIGFSDPNNDPLSVKATVTRKEDRVLIFGPMDLTDEGLTPSGQATKYQLEFRAPRGVGLYVISIVASDGKLSTEHRFEFRVNSCSKPIPHFTQKVEIDGIFKPIALDEEFVDSVAENRTRTSKDLGGGICVPLPIVGKVCESGVMVEKISGVYFQLAPKDTEVEGMVSTDLPKWLAVDPETGAVVAITGIKPTTGKFKALIRAIDSTTGTTLAELWLDLDIKFVFTVTVSFPPPQPPTPPEPGPTDPSGGGNTQTPSMPSNENPIANPGGPYSGIVPCVTVNGIPKCTGTVTINFDGTGSHDPDGSIVEWRWEFGDGAIGGGGRTTKSYDVDMPPGSTSKFFTVRLTVTDDKGATSSAVTQVLVSGQVVTNSGGNF